jgi:NitT/TauT family transport system substrate-binding protein
MHRRNALSLVASAVGATLIASSPRRAAGQTPLEKIRIAGPLTEDFVSLYYGIKTGMFGRAGLDIEMVGTSNGSAATEAVVSGTYEMAKSAVTSIIAAHIRSIPLTIVGPQAVYTSKNPFSLLQIAPDAPFKSGADLSGKVVGVPSLNSIGQLAVRAWVDKNGGDWRSIKFVEIPNSAQVAALTDHRIDAAMLQSPQMDESIGAGTSKTLGDAYGAIAPVFMIAAYIARSDWAATHADTLRRFDTVNAQATTYVNTHPLQTAPLVTELTKINLDVDKMHRTLNATTVDPRIIQALIDSSAKYEITAKAFPAREIIWGE